MTHNLKISKYFAEPILNGNLTFLTLMNDEGFQKGDIVFFKVVEDIWPSLIPLEQSLLDIPYEITYVLSGWGIKEGFVTFSFRKVEDKNQIEKILKEEHKK